MTVRVSVARWGGAALAVWLVAACDGEGQGGLGRIVRGAVARDSAAGVVVITRTPYQAARLAAVGTVQGTVESAGTLPADSVHAVPAAAVRACGAQVIQSPVAVREIWLEEAVVWLESLTRGKPLPELRRAELTFASCRSEPRVQAVVSGTTLNIGNDDRVAHTVLLGRLGAAIPLLRIPFMTDGQVVPSERLAREAGIIEASSRELPWVRAWVAVFDHPYFAVTAGGGRFTIDSVPPGRYTLKIWHPRGTEVMERPVTVSAGATAVVEARMAVR